MGCGEKNLFSKKFFPAKQFCNNPFATFYCSVTTALYAGTVTGFSEYFTSLSPEQQQEIIKRTEYDMTANGQRRQNTNV